MYVKRLAMYIQKLIIVLFLSCFIFSCENTTDSSENTESYDQYYNGSFRNNQDGTVEVTNNTSHDMLLFASTIISLNSIIGGVKAGDTNTINFSDEVDYQLGGYKVLRAIKESEFDARKETSAIDWTAMVTYSAGTKFYTSIVSILDGDYCYIVTNGSNDYALELRKNSPDGEKIVLLTRGETRKRIYCSSNNIITLYPVWVAFNTATHSLVTWPTSILSAQEICPVRPSEDPNQYYFLANESETIDFSGIDPGSLVSP